MQSLFGGISLSPALSVLFSSLLAFIVSLIAIPVIVRIARNKNLVDRPNHRTSHAVATPILGGVAIFAGLILGGGLFLPVDDLSPFRYILASIIVLFFIGQKDDLESISARSKFIAQLLASLSIVVLADIRIISLHGFLGVHGIPDWLSILISVFLIILIINSFNLIDGIDGLASGMGILVAFFFGLWLYGIGQVAMAVMAGALIGGLLPFFYFNVFGKKNKLFMGDTGSMLVGLMVSVFVIKVCSREVPADHFLHMNAAPSVAIGILIYPLFDLLRVFFIRISRGRSPFSPDRNHIHHIFLDAGYSHRRSTFYILATNLVAIAWAWFFRNGSIVFLAVTLLVGAIVLTTIMHVFQKKVCKKVD